MSTETKARTSATGGGSGTGAGIAQPRLGPIGWLRWMWRQLTSMRTALFLLLLLAIGAIPVRHLILIGKGWKQTFEAFFDGQKNNVNAQTRAILQFAADAESAVALLEQEKE